MLIRPVQESDFPAIATLTNKYIVGSSVHFGYEPVTAEELCQSWRKNAPRYPFLVSEERGAFTGYAKAGVWRERAAYGWTAEVGIYVEPTIHRKGVGRVLYQRLFDIMREQGFHSAIGGITLPNDASIRLHENMGFKSVGTVRQAGWKLGAWHDVAFYQLLLRQADHAAGEIQPPGLGRMA
ncbi:MAG: N-acetyltransferase [Pyrinomonadaceae bacterium]|nr:N-acetyltransferase [Phycisphaerales bacterium]